jgi:V/A-type H+-transporting ATPase subunit I
MLEPMVKIEIVGVRRMLDPTMACLQRCASVQLLDAASELGLNPAPRPADEGELGEGARLRHLGTRLDALISLAVVPPPPDGDPPVPTRLSQVAAELEELAPSVEPLVTRIDEMEAERSTLPRHIESLRRLAPLVPRLPELEAYETVAILVERRHATVIGWVREELAALLDTHFEVISDQVDPDTVGAVLVFPRDQSRRVHALLAERQVSRVHLPDEYRNLSLASAITSMEQRIADLPGEIESTRAALVDLLSVRTHWHAARVDVARRLAQLDALRMVGTTERAFAIIGWAPRRHLDELANALQAEVGGEVLLSDQEARPDEPPPVLLRNPTHARPFELFLGMLALPRYGTFDPTVLMAIFMPFFFGLMLGDIAYGLALFALATWAGGRWGPRSDVVADLTRVLRMGAVWAVIWGVVFGEVLGDLGHRLVGLEPLWIDRQEAIGPLLLFAIGIGAAHIILGLVLGLWTAVQTANRRLLGERVALLVALCALFVVAGVAANRLPSGLMTPSVVAVVVALAVLIALEWPLGLVMGPLDLIGAVSNVLSYLRIAAIGLASVFLARVANELGAAAPLLLGLAIAALFHALNLALGTFSPTIQALRLHYVEFFDKFYEPGGERFTPFGAALAAEPEVAVPPSVLIET